MITKEQNEIAYNNKSCVRNGMELYLSNFI